MAAAEFYGRRPSASYLAPPPPLQQSYSYSQPNQAQSYSPQLNSQAPPPMPQQIPLDPNRPNVYFSQQNNIPQQQPHRYSSSGGQRPNLQSWQSTPPPPLNSQYQPPTHHQSQPQIYSTSPVQQPQYLSPQQHYPSNPAGLYPPTHDSSQGYLSDPEHHRHRHRKRRSSHNAQPRDRSASYGGRDKEDRSRSTNADGLIGASAGGLIGDLLLPGVGGALGGAIVGWLGGKDYGSHRKWREEKRQKEESDWQRKFGSSHDGSVAGGRRPSDARRSRSHEPPWDGGGENGGNGRRGSGG